MKVILREEITNVGDPGDIVKVSDGFARNYLFPQKKALPATEENIRNVEKLKKSFLKKQANKKSHLEEVAKQLSDVQCVIEKKGGKNNKLFGSVTNQDIHKALEKQGYTLDKRTIKLESPIKEVGDFDVSVHLSAEVQATIKVTVKATQ